MYRPLVMMAFTAVAMLASPARAPAHEARKVTSSTLNVRSGPGTSYAIVGTAHYGEVYVVVSKLDTWLKIWWKGGPAWVSGLYTQGVSGNGVKITMSSVTVRTGPGTSYVQVGSVASPQIYYGIATSGGWSQIYWGGGKSWVSSLYTTQHMLYAAPPVATTGPQDLGSFTITYYYLPFETDYSGTPSTPIYDAYGRLIAYAPQAFVDEITMEGSGKLRDGRVVTYNANGRFGVVDAPWGLGASGAAIIPYKSIAVDPAVIPFGSKIFIQEAVGLKLPDGTVHDGIFYAHDTGGWIKGTHIDIHAGQRQNLSLFSNVGVVTGVHVYSVEVPPPPPVLFKARVTTGPLNVREGPGTAYAIVGTLPSGTVVDVYGTNNGWYKILYNGAFRWILGSYTEAVSNGGVIFKAKITATTLYVRTGPGTSYPIVGNLTYGVIVDVYETKNGWYKILYNGAYQWIIGTYAVKA